MNSVWKYSVHVSLSSITSLLLCPSLSITHAHTKGKLYFHFLSGSGWHSPCRASLKQIWQYISTLCKWEKCEGDIGLEDRQKVCVTNREQEVRGEPPETRVIPHQWVRFAQYSTGSSLSLEQCWESRLDLGNNDCAVVMLKYKEDWNAI